MIRGRIFLIILFFFFFVGIGKMFHELDFYVRGSFRIISTEFSGWSQRKLQGTSDDKFKVNILENGTAL